MFPPHPEKTKQNKNTNKPNPNLSEDLKLRTIKINQNLFKGGNKEYYVENGFIKIGNYPEVKKCVIWKSNTEDT